MKYEIIDKLKEQYMLNKKWYSLRWHYIEACILKSYLDSYEQTGKEEYYKFAKNFIDDLYDERGNIPQININYYSIDQIRMATILFVLYKKEKDEKYRRVLDLIYKQLKTYPRTKSGSFWHKENYPNQIWLDGLYMGSPFYAEFIKEFGNKEEFDDVTKQFLLCEKHTKDDATGLLYHAYDEKKEMFWCNKETGHSKNFWGRSMGWYVMAIVDVLDYIPEDHKDRARIIEILNEVLEALLKVQDKETGLWYQVLDQGNRKGNYLEASASCMILYAIAKGLRKGYIPEKWLEVAKKSYKGVIEEFVTVTAAGLVNLNKVCAVAGLGGKDMRDGTFEYYISEPIVSNDAKGVGAFIQASTEMENLYK